MANGLSQLLNRKYQKVSTQILSAPILHIGVSAQDGGCSEL